VTDYLAWVRQTARALTEAQRERDLAITEAVRHGSSQTDVGKAAAISRQRVNQIVTGTSPAPELAFWGAPEAGVVIAAGEKQEAPKDVPGPLATVLDSGAREAYEIIRSAVTEAGIGARYEAIAPHEFVRLNRDGLVVICGPRLSPQIGEVLESDRVLGFAKDDGGWYLFDRESGESWHSPLDHGEPCDYGYIGRLPRPDGRGTFLYIAGIHGAGCAGGAHYLTSNLGDLWRDVKGARFSAIIRCGLAGDGSVAFSELAAGPYLRDR
jgi:hypothetical protein